jgi:predicted nucleic acid-binding Zn ribbon protein
MAEAHVGPLPEGTKHCPVCAEPINSKAWKCIHCQSELGRWRRRLSLSSTVLALIVALVSVLGTTTPPIIEAMKPKKSIAYILQDVTAGGITIVASNVGTRQGIVTTASLSMLDMYVSLKMPTSHLILKPGDTAVVNFTQSDAVFVPKIDMSKIMIGTPCYIDVQTVDAESEKDTRLTASCGRLYAFIYALAHLGEKS